ncbi:MAG: oligopeptide/dipeptide transporter, ATPase subunit [Symbiobacteriaceae bacterium]|jgi:peptide/nickel transport system ATP-binding protein|nr:oligopeptide/dipeptide transporter, ATPase subunit [Symbiobacteriaceae bacterium]
MTFRKGSPWRRSEVRAVDHVTLDMDEGSILALVGESGCGKTTIGKAIAGLYRPTQGQVLYRGKDIWKLSKAEFRTYRREVQLVHQDSFAALNPSLTIYQSLSAPLLQYGLVPAGKTARTVVGEYLEMVELTPPDQFLDKYPHQLSGGQRQRVVLARALTVRPKLIVADEPVSMVDVSLRLALLNLMARMNKEMGVSFAYITHDLATARYLAGQGQISVMYLGEMVETGPVGQVLATPRHPYLQALLSAVPVPDPIVARSRKMLALRSLEMPDPGAPPAGCRFHPRCPYAEAVCSSKVPTLEAMEGGDRVACHLKERIPAWPV